VKLRVELRAMVRELQLESGITTVFVTHDQEEALALSDVVAVMDRGRIVQIGAPMEIYARPATGYAADFLGSANLIPVGDGTYKVARREEIEIGRGDLRGRVEGVEFRGSVTGYRIRTDFGLIHVDVWSVQHGRTYERGEEVRLAIRDDARIVEKS
jgi:iron(III) transport system ATP-binding protein